MLLFAWIQESIVFEGYLHNYLYVENHLIIRSLLRIFDSLILILIGYAGLKTFNLKWVIQLWIGWYSIVLVSAGIRMLPAILFHVSLNGNLWSFLTSFYAASFTPLPYIFLCFLAVLIQQKNSK
jgi:lipid-A-disaccharide synthase-like uncharacterized protein